MRPPRRPKLLGVILALLLGATINYLVASIAMQLPTYPPVPPFPAASAATEWPTPPPSNWLSEQPIDRMILERSPGHHTAIYNSLDHDARAPQWQFPSDDPGTRIKYEMVEKCSGWPWSSVHVVLSLHTVSTYGDMQFEGVPLQAASL